MIRISEDDLNKEFSKKKQQQLKNFIDSSLIYFVYK